SPATRSRSRSARSAFSKTRSPPSDWTRSAERPSPMTEPAERLTASVLVVGAGPTGLTLANLLGQWGVDVILIERHNTTVQEPRAVSIDDESLRTMQAAGLIAEVAKDVVMAGYGYHYFTREGVCFAKVLPSSADYGYPRRCPFQQPLLEA